MSIAEQYIDDVLAGRVVVNNYIKLAVRRHLDLLDRAQEKGYYFDEDSANHTIRIIRRLRHTAGEFAGELFRLSGWQAFLLHVIFGWKVKKTGFRLINKAYIEIAKKNGKTELAAAIAIYMAFFDDEKGAEVYIGAKKKAQSAICFRAIKYMIRHMRAESDTVHELIQEPQLYNANSKALNSKIEPLAKDAKGDMGINTHCGIIDEYHVHPDTEVHDNIESSMVSRSQPLDFIITTAGSSLESPCFKLRKTATEILQGIKEDDTFFTLIFCFDDEDDWEDIKNWVKPIPNLNVSVREENVISQFVKAKNEGSAKLRSFKTLNLNMWQASNFETFIKDDDWQACEMDFKVETLRGRQCFMGLDMAATSDIASYCLFFPAQDPGEKHRLIWRYFLPGETIEEKEHRDKVRYRDWARDGWFILLPGNVILSDIGLSVMQEHIANDFRTYDIALLGYDRWNAYGLISNLVEDGVNPEILAPYGMGYKSMSTPMNYFGQWVENRKIEHLPDPVIRWMVSNCIPATDGINIKPDRPKSINKIDGFVAALIAIGQYFIFMSDNTPRQSMYENTELWDE